MALFTVIGLLLQALPVELPVASTVSAAFGATFAGLVLFGPAAGVLVGMAVGLWGSLVPRRLRWSRLAFNAGSGAVGAALAGAVYWWGVQAFAAQPLFRGIASVILTPLAHFLWSAGSVSLAIHLDRGIPLAEVWRQNYRWLAPQYALLVPTAALMATAYQHLGWWAAVAFALPLVALRHSMQLNLEHRRRIREQMQELERYARALTESNAALGKANARLEARIQELQSLAAGARVFGRAWSLKDALDGVARLAEEALGHGVAFLALIDRVAEGEGHRPAVYGRLAGDRRVDPERLAALAPLTRPDPGHPPGAGDPPDPPAVGTPGAAGAPEGEAAEAQLVLPMERVLDPAVARAHGAAPEDDALAVLPLVADGRHLGVLGITCRSDEIPQRLDALRVFAVQAASAIVAERARERARALETTDRVTGFPARRPWLEALLAAAGAARDAGRPLSVLLVDVDGLRFINARHGEAAGDQVLASVARTIREAAGRDAVAGRFSSDEFGVLLPGLGAEEALAVAEVIRRRVAGHDIRVPASGSLATSVSIGVATLPDHAKDDTTLLERALDAQFQAVLAGRNAVAAYDPSRPARPPGDTDLPARPWQDLYLDTIRALAYMVDAREGSQFGHSLAVERCATAIARRMGLDEVEVRRIQKAALLHDIGKVGLSEAVTRKAGPLTPVEYEVVKQHPVVAAQILGHIDFLEDLVPLVYHHQERFDGTGYPDGLAGEAIPRGARIIAVADAYAAMTAVRSYRPARTEAEALEELRRQAGTQFDPRAVEALAAYLAERADEPALR